MTTDLPVEPAPALPYRVEDVLYPIGVTRPTKIYANGMGGPLLTPDETAVWAYVTWLRQENARLESLLAGSRPFRGRCAAPAAFQTPNDPVPAPGVAGPPAEPTATPAKMPRREPRAETPVPTIATGPAVPAPEPATGPPHAPAVATESTGSKATRPDVAAALKANPHLSNGVHAQNLGLSAERVRQIRRALIDAGELQPVETVVGRDGQEQSATKAGADAGTN